ncbi:PbpX, partial [Listeria seeligeri FSL N1-067]
NSIVVLLFPSNLFHCVFYLIQLSRGTIIAPFCVIYFIHLVFLYSRDIFPNTFKHFVNRIIITISWH